MRGDRALWAGLLVLAAVAGVVMRVLVWTSPLGQPEGDEGVWGLMASHLLEGELPAFYWGQGYGGTLEVILTAPVVWVAGLSWLTIRLVPLALTAVAAVLVWRVGRRTIGEPAAVAAAAVFWVFPAYLVWKSIRAHGFYGSGLVLTLLFLLLVLRLAERRRRADALLLGLVGGLVLWQTMQVVTIALPALAWLVWRRPGVLRDAWLAVPAAVVGALPSIVSNLRHDWWSLHLKATEVPSYTGRLRGFASGTLPMALDLRRSFTSEWLVAKPVGGALYLGLLAAFAVFAWRARGTPRSLFVVIALCFPFLYAVSTYTFLFDEPRYLVLLMPVLVLLLCSRITTPARLGAALAAAVALAAWSLAAMDVRHYRVQADGHLVPAQFSPLVRTLDELGIRRAFSHYWIAYRLDFETDERIIAAEADLGHLSEARPGAVLPDPPEPSIRRIEYDTVVRRVRSPAWILRSGSPRDRRWGPLLRRAGYRRVETGGFVVWHRGVASRGL